LKICEDFRILDSSENLESVLQIDNFIVDSSVHNPVYAEIFDKDDTHSLESSLLSNQLCVVIAVYQEESSKAINSLNGILSGFHIVVKIFRLQSFSLENRLKIRGSQAGGSKRSDGLAIVLCQILGGFIVFRGSAGGLCGSSVSSAGLGSRRSLRSH